MTAPQLEVELPGELLIEIFLHARSEPNPVSPLTLGKVCQSWRTIAFSLASLWASVDLIVHHGFRTQVILLEHWLDRAQNLPLALSIGSARNLRLTLDDWDQLFQLIGRKAKQISSISFALPGPIYGQLTKIDTDWPVLTQVSFSTSHQDDHIFFRPSPLRTFERSPQLAKAIIKQFFFHSFTLPWDNLVHLQLHRAAAYEVFNAIEFCKNLQDFRITLALELQQWQGPRRLVTTHENIRHFTFEVQQIFANEFAYEAFVGLRLPKLKSLVFRLPSQRPRGEFYLPSPFPLTIFTPKRCTQLESLAIHFGHLEVAVFLLSLSLFFGLRHLDLHRVSWDNSHNLLHPIGGLTTFVPNLSTLKFEGEVNFAPEVVIRFLESRWDAANAGALKSVTFIGSGENWVITEYHKQKIKDWRDRGFSVTIR